MKETVHLHLPDMVRSHEQRFFLYFTQISRTYTNYDYRGRYTYDVIAVGGAFYGRSLAGAFDIYGDSLIFIDLTLTSTVRLYRYLLLRTTGNTILSLAKETYVRKCTEVVKQCNAMTITEAGQLANFPSLSKTRKPCK